MERTPYAEAVFSRSCTRCPRLVSNLVQVRARYPGYYALPVPPFGDRAAHLLVVGLAPGLHGANASGRAFTGDHAGILLYRTLHRFGFASAPESRTVYDDLVLHDCRITNTVKCLPPANKPNAAEIANCNGYLAADLASLPRGAVVVALGRVAHEAVLRALALPLRSYRFAHGAQHELDHTPAHLLDSYHCSRYNTQTGRLTTPMFEQVFAQARQLLDAGAPP